MDMLISWLKGLQLALASPRRQAGLAIHGQGQWVRDPGEGKGTFCTAQLCCSGGTSFFKEGEIWREMGQPT